ncbi:hypothetical protein [Hymenobacter metallicola]|uniref:Uncharacterized protein n=1 Tax=Hymenobacter metallicola TaxID=2563114 RepID=A0A4Z0QEB6_9BACT|nr:hypothetical protein [Hymenobacter metallicola]TGE28410.1 hypothetical protein E5K02_02795 [Hymenobacter metallicola]
MLLVVLATGGGLLLLGLLVAVGALGRASLRVLVRDFLLVRLAAASASVMLPLVMGTAAHGHSLPALLAPNSD